MAGNHSLIIRVTPLNARSMGPIWGPSGADRTQVGPMLAPWTLLSGSITITFRDYYLRVWSCDDSHYMETFSTLLAPCREKHRSAAGLIHKGPTTRGFGVFFVDIMLSQEAVEQKIALLNQCWRKWAIRYKIQHNFNKKYHVYSTNAFENLVWKMAKL